MDSGLDGSNSIRGMATGWRHFLGFLAFEQGPPTACDDSSRCIHIPLPMRSAPFHADGALPTLPVHHRPQPVPPHGVRGSPARLASAATARACSRKVVISASKPRPRLEPSPLLESASQSEPAVGDGCVGARGTWRCRFVSASNCGYYAKLQYQFLVSWPWQGTQTFNPSLLNFVQEQAAFIRSRSLFLPAPLVFHPLITSCVTMSTWALNESPSLGSRRVNQTRVQASSQVCSIVQLPRYRYIGHGKPSFLLTCPSSSLD